MKSLLIAMLLASTFGPAGQAQSTPDKPVPIVKTFFLTNINSGADAENVTSAVRNAVRDLFAVYVPPQNAIVVRGTPDQLAQVQQVLSSFDRPKRSYRVTYTISDFDGTQLIGKQRYAMIISSGGHTTVKQESKVPVISGSYSADNVANAQYTYHDVGLDFDASLDDYVDGIRLHTRVERSSLAEDKDANGGGHPILRQQNLEGTSIVMPGKPLVLGSIDTPGSTRRLDIDVVIEAVK